MLIFSLIISNCEDRVLFMLILLTGVLCHFFKLISSYQVLHLFSTGVLFEFVLPSSQFLFSTAVLTIVFNSDMFFLSTFQPLKVLWFHSFVEEATQFYLFSSSSVSLRCHSRSRDEILLQWWSVVTPQDRSFRCLPGFPSFAVCFFCACSFIFALHHVIMPSCQ